jgi:hypothetical protein
MKTMYILIPLSFIIAFLLTLLYKYIDSNFSDKGRLIIYSSICFILIIVLIVLISKLKIKKYDYKLNLRKDYRVELIDSDNNIIQTTTLDSIPYYINEDNK